MINSNRHTDTSASLSSSFSVLLVIVNREESLLALESSPSRIEDSASALLLACWCADAFSSLPSSFISMPIINNAIRGRREQRELNSAEEHFAVVRKENILALGRITRRIDFELKEKEKERRRLDKSIDSSSFSLPFFSLFLHRNSQIKSWAQKKKKRARIDENRRCCRCCWFNLPIYSICSRCRHHWALPFSPSSLQRVILTWLV